MLRNSNNSNAADAADLLMACHRSVRGEVNRNAHIRTPCVRRMLSARMRRD